MSKEHLDYSSISAAMTEALTDTSNVEDNLEVENDLTNELFEGPESVIEKLISSATKRIKRVLVLVY